VLLLELRYFDSIHACDRQTDRQTPHGSIYRTMRRHRAVKTDNNVSFNNTLKKLSVDVGLAVSPALLADSFQTTYFFFVYKIIHSSTQYMYFISRKFPLGHGTCIMCQPGT